MILFGMGLAATGAPLDPVAQRLVATHQDPIKIRERLLYDQSHTP
jgi:hypothetical protein